MKSVDIDVVEREGKGCIFKLRPGSKDLNYRPGRAYCRNNLAFLSAEK